MTAAENVTMTATKLHLRLPATSANLGPGFDTLALALDMHLEITAEESDAFRIHATGRNPEICGALDRNLLLDVYRKTLAANQREVKPLALEVNNQIPLGMGCGSSAAVRLAGVALAAHFGSLEWDRDRILSEATRLEGHPDNVAACVLGSIVASAIDAGGVARAVRVELAANYRLAVVVPDFILPTSEARRVLPDHYSRQDVIFNVQRSALLIAALATGTTSAFPAAFEDRLHQPYRYALVPGLEEMVRLRAPGLLGCALSGAGPAILVFYEKGCEQVCDLVRQIFALHEHQSEALWIRIAEHGYELSA